jgi:archaellum component FlaC
MWKSGKIAIVLLVFVALASLSATAIIYYYLTSEKAKSESLEEQLVQILSAKRLIEDKLKTSKGEIENLKLQLSESKSKIDDLNSQLKLEKIAREQIMTERDNLLAQLNDKTALLQESSQELLKTKEKIKTLERQISKSRMGIEPLTEAAGQTEQVELGTIVVGQGEIPDGEILSVNKKYDFVVINLGQRDGVNAGQVFSVYRKTKFLGDIEVVNAQAELSTANLLPDAKIKYFRKGDKVIPKKNEP